MKRMLLSFLACTLPIICNASDTVGAEHSISSVYTGVIGKSNVTMNLVNSKDIVSGSYVYDKYKNKILLNGTINSNSLELKEKINGSEVIMSLTRTDQGYTGKWCDIKCLPVTIQSNNSFRDGELYGVDVDDTDMGSYKIKIKFKHKNETVIVSDAIDLPSLEFVDINGDGFYDLIATTEHRPNNGSQTIYLSSDSGFIKDDALSKENGTLIYEPYKKEIIFNSKDDCCNNFHKVIYYINNGKIMKGDIISFDYSASKGENSKGERVSKEQFESH